MDTFIDKLAQKLTAQEMIKANAAADAEEMKRMQAQIKEYQECLKRMEHICQLVEDTADEACRQMEDTANEACRQLRETADDAQAKLEVAAMDSEDIDRVVEAGLTKIRQIQQNTEKMDDVHRKIDDVRQELDTARQEIEEKIEEELGEIRARQFTADDIADVAGGIQGISQKLENMPREDKISAILEEKLEASGETIHKECVKVYRNVQAVISEENTKQMDSLNDATKSFSGKLKVTMAASFAAVAFSLIGVVLQVLSWLKLL